MVELCKTLAIALQAAPEARGAEVEVRLPRGRRGDLGRRARRRAARTARKKALDIETVLIEEFQRQGRPRSARRWPSSSASTTSRSSPTASSRWTSCKNLKREYVARAPVGAARGEPARACSSCASTRSGSRARGSSTTSSRRRRIIYCVTTLTEFRDTLDLVLRRRRRPRRHRRPARGPGRRRTRRRRRRDRRPVGGRRQRAGEAREQDHRRRLPPGRVRHPHRVLPGQGARPRSASARTARSCPTSRCRPPTATRSSRASRSCATSTSPSAASRRTARSSSRSSGRSTSSCGWRRSRSQGGVEDIVMRILAAGEPIPLDKLGSHAAQPAAAQGGDREALRPVLLLRADRLRQDDHAALGARLPQHARHQDLDRRGPGRDHPEGPAPGADQPQGGAGLRRRS